MTRDEFQASCAARVADYWPSFARGWNPMNREVAFKLLSPFRIDQVLTALDDHRYENPDARFPEFKAIAGKLWGLRRAAAPVNQKDRDFRMHAQEWARNQSDDDVSHYRQVGMSRASSVAPKLVCVIDESPLRSPISLIVAWAAARDVDLSFSQGSHECQESFLEYDIAERKRENARIGKWGTKTTAAKFAVAAQTKHLPVSPLEQIALLTASQDSTTATMEPPEDGIPF